MAKLPLEVLGDGPSLPLPGSGVRLFFGLWPLSYNLCLCLHLAASPGVCCVSLFLRYCCRKRDPFGAQEWILIWHLEMNCPRRHLMTKQEALFVALSLGFYGNWVPFWIVPGQSL